MERFISATGFSFIAHPALLIIQINGARKYAKKTTYIQLGLKRLKTFIRKAAQIFFRA